MFPSHFDFSASVRHALVKADLIHQLINTLNPQSLSFEEAEDIHINIMAIIDHSLHPATPIGLTQMPIKSADDEQDVHETVLKQVLVPSEEYICHLCVNRCLIMDDDLSHEFMLLLAEILRICPYNQQTMALLFLSLKGHPSLLLRQHSHCSFVEVKASMNKLLSQMELS
ncbi:hypothetical protein BLNAU_24644 [Blattamonas nauphoetae]|uniref:Uncharacterized protein n=1 Tax=Blattamonas nauphoetae TaxID=2049346 RepID=A0ABQ9WM89_9EUKA|nr:hypothetical protein BLNAU_24644 [Blattamonas nauphoetae]